MIRKVSLLTIFLVILSGLSAAQGFRVLGDLHVDKDETVGENLLSWKGKVEIRGILNESLFIIGGEATISGTVKKDVIGFSTSIILEPGTRIQGELLLIGGSLQMADDVVIKGGHLHFRYDLNKLRTSLHPIFSDSRSMGFFRAVKSIIWFVIALLTFMLFPRAVIHAEGNLSSRPWRMGLIGTGTLFAFICMAFISLLLSFLIIGIPLLFLLVLAWFAVLILGRTVIMYAVGSRLIRRLGYSGSSAAFALLAGTLLFGLLKFIPVAGTVALILINLFEIGVGSSYLVRRFIRRSSP